MNSPEFGTLSTRAQLAVKVRAGEKVILHSVIEAYAQKEQRMIRAAQKLGKDHLHEDL